MTGARFTRSFLLLFSAPLVWAVHFLAIYAWTAVLCERPEWRAERLIPWGVVLASAAAIGVIAAINLRAWSRRKEPDGNAGFVQMTAAALGLLIVIAIVWETLPVFLVPVCG